MIIKKFIIWGYTDLTSYTHSWIMLGFHRALKSLNHEVYWFDNIPSNFDFSNSLFIVEGTFSSNVPIREDCFYILHNCDKLVKKVKNYIQIQVFTNDVYKKENILPVPNEKYMYYSIKRKTLYFFWATDLLPEQIDKNIEYVKLNFKKQRNIACFVGSIWQDPQKIFGNMNEIRKYVTECKKNNVLWERYEHVSQKEHEERIKDSFYTFTIVGAWQKEKGYIPCRIFKNISYGGFAITNSKIVSNLFSDKICYSNDESELFYKSKEYINNITLDEQIKLMEYVRDNHTYINRIKTILWFCKKITNS